MNLNDYWVLKINNAIASYHSLEYDVLAQKARFIADGISAEVITITEPV
jgi:hypothetical protein